MFWNFVPLFWKLSKKKIFEKLHYGDVSKVKKSAIIKWVHLFGAPHQCYLLVHQINPTKTTRISWIMSRNIRCLYKMYQHLHTTKNHDTIPMHLIISTAQHILASHTKTTAVITNLPAPPSPRHPLLQYDCLVWYRQAYYSWNFNSSTQWCLLR